MPNFYVPEKTGELFIADGLIRVDLDKEKAFARDRPLRLRPKEYGSLALMAENPGHIITYPCLRERVWGFDGNYDIRDTIKATVNNLRTALGPEFRDCRRGAIRTERKLGYYAVQQLSGRSAPRLRL